MRRSIGLHWVGVCAVGMFAACVGDDPAPGSIPPDTDDARDGATPATDAGTTPGVDGAIGADAANEAALTLAVSRATVKVGTSITLEATLERGGLEGELPIVVSGLPTGVTVQPVAFAAGSSTASIVLSATAAAVLGEAPLRIEVAGASAASCTLLVAGISGTLDTTFDNDGLVFDTESENQLGVLFAVTVQPDQSILAAGAINGEVGGGWVVRHFRADGTPDSDFDTAAAAAVPKMGSARGIAVDAETGKIIVVGSSAATERLTVVRLNSNGSADQQFSNGGTLLVSTVEHPSGSRGLSVLVLTGSKILVAGAKTQGNNQVGIVEQYTAGGERDSQFVPFQSAEIGTLTGLLPLASGSFVATGTNTASSPPSQLVVRLLANGTPDAAFAGGSRTYASGCRGAASALASNGDVVVVGQDVRGPSFCATRVAGSGTGDLVYTKTVAGGNSEQFTAAASGPNGTSYAAGNGGGSVDKFARIERRGADGELDPAFATNGVLELADPATPDTYGYRIHAATTTTDGRLVVVGSRTVSSRGYFVGRIWP